MSLNKIILILIAFNFCLMSYPQELPKPDKLKLYTEFDFVRSSKYLKKPLAGSGYIAMDGNDKFIFKQITPIVIEVRKNNKKFTFKKGNSQPVEIDPQASEDIMFYFDSNENIAGRFSITLQTIDNINKYQIIPKNKENIKVIEVNSSKDKVEKINIIFNDGSNISYTFKNTVTGVTPDEKYFK